MISRKLITIGLCMLVISTLILATGCEQPPKKKPVPIPPAPTPITPPPPPTLCPPHDYKTIKRKIPGCPDTWVIYERCKRCPSERL